ncbi:DUF490 domain-containing protein [Pseudothauera rhizosphaerae]|uniref:DUF490 domain-containing protein n=1 Tax=Pseudothauera rhizosphaerae TaxID=2565932 RepID=A0A4S4AT90_9RHOO|nr:DUF490 domain-containing protein [Pseudothauera rhizosphaerae]
MLALAWLLGSESGLHAALRLAGWASGGQFSASAASGRLLGPLAVGSLRFDNPTLRVAVEGLQFDWQPAALLSGRVHIDRLAAAGLAIASAPDESPSTAPPTPPASLRLPFAFALDRLQVDRVAVLPWQAEADAAPLFAVEHISGTARGGAEGHRVADLALDLPGVRVVLEEFELAGDAPFALAGLGRVEGRLAERPFAARYELAGDLLAPRLRLDAQGEGLAGQADVLAAPFAAVPVRRLQLALGEVDPAAFVEGAPQAALRLNADLQGEAAAPGDDAAQAWALAGPLSVDNALPGTLDANRLPFTRIAGRLHWHTRQTRVDALEALLPGDGRLTGWLAWTPPPAAEEGEEDAPPSLLPGRLQAEISLTRIVPALLHAALPELSVSGEVTAEAAGAQQNLALRLQAEGAKLDARLALDGSADATAPAFDLTAALRGLDPQRVQAELPAGRLGFDAAARGRLGDPLRAELDLKLADSLLSGQAFTGGGRLKLEGTRLTDADLALALAGNRVLLAGAWGAPGDRLHVAVDAPRLAALGFGLGGRLGVSAMLTGTPAEPAGEFALFAERLTLPGGVYLVGANGQGRLDAGLEGPFQLALGLSGLGAADGEGAAWLDTAHLAAAGTRSTHRVGLSAVRGEDTVTAELDGGLHEGEGRNAALHWRGRLSRLESTGVFPARLVEPADLQAGPERVELGPAQLDAGGQGSIRLARTLWTPRAAELRGTLTGLSFGLHQRADGRRRRGPGALVLGAEWDLRLADAVEGELRLYRESGDLEVSGEISTRLGLEHFEAWLTARDNRLALSLDARGSEFGTLSGSATALAERAPAGGWRLVPDGELLGSARLAMPSIAWMGRLMQQNVDTAGSLEAEFTVAGTPADPLASGRIAGRDISIALVDQGLHLSGGEIAAQFDRDRLRLARLAFVSPNRVRPHDPRPPVDRLTATPGTLTASGEIALDSGAGHFAFRADRLPLLQRPDRWLILSGTGEARSTWTTLSLDADFRADAGYVEIADTPAPSLSDDVVVLGREPASGGGLGVEADIRVALGDHLYLSALGVDTRLTGELHLRRSDGRPLAATGTIATAGGTFRGYGQNLTIERGLINFQGALDNPGLNVVALRKGLAVEAGVAVVGTARRPQVRLVSEPSVPDPEKLSWIVLGRAPDAAAGADLGLLLPAAQALLGGPGGGMTDQLSRSLGFDEFSIGEGEVGGVSRRATSRVVGSGTAVDGGGTVGGQVLTLGKRLSSDVFLSFEQSLGGAESLVKLTYQLSRRVSLVARGGTDNAIDAYYTFSFR